jgi:nitrous oxidase accessory protein
MAMVTLRRGGDPSRRPYGSGPGRWPALGLGALLLGAALAVPAVHGRGATSAARAATGLSAPTTPPAPAQPAPRGRVLRVAPDGDARTIADAIRLARDGDIIRIGPGVYREAPITVDRAVTLEGQPGAVLDGEDRHTILLVTADDVAVRGLELRNAGVSQLADNAAIVFEEVRGCRAEDNVLTDNFFGIYLARATDCVVARNRLAASGTREVTSGNGIHLWNAAGVRVEDNVIRGHRDGIYLEFAKDVLLRGNVSEDNLRYGLHFMFSDATRYAGNAFRRNGAGVAVMYSRTIEMTDNRFEDNWGPAAYGLLLKDIADSRIEGNRFVRNTVGLFSEGSMRVTVHGNRFVNNGWAVRLLASSQENVFTGNDFVNNAFDVTTNSRRNFNTFNGNHWSRYDGYDLTGDGVGDVPHRPVRLFALIVERSPAAMVLLRSPFVDVLDAAERVMPVLTPETLVDTAPRMREVNP